MTRPRSVPVSPIRTPRLREPLDGEPLVADGGRLAVPAARRRVKGPRRRRPPHARLPAPCDRGDAFGAARCVIASVQMKIVCGWSSSTRSELLSLLPSRQQQVRGPALVRGPYAGGPLSSASTVDRVEPRIACLVEERWTNWMAPSRRPRRRPGVAPSRGGRRPPRTPAEAGLEQQNPATPRHRTHGCDEARPPTAVDLPGPGLIPGAGG